MVVLRRAPVAIVVLLLLFAVASPAAAESPAVVRDLTCSDGTIFEGQQVRRGATPHSWVSTTPGTFPSAFIVHALIIYSPDGQEVVESLTLGSYEAVSRSHEIVTCGFTIRSGPFENHPVEFFGYFVP